MLVATTWACASEPVVSTDGATQGAGSTGDTDSGGMGGGAGSTGDTDSGGMGGGAGAPDAADAGGSGGTAGPGGSGGVAGTGGGAGSGGGATDVGVGAGLGGSGGAAGTGGGAGGGATGGGTAPAEPWFPCGDAVEYPRPSSDCAPSDVSECEPKLRAAAIGGNAASYYQYFYDQQGRRACVLQVGDGYEDLRAVYSYADEQVTESVFTSYCPDFCYDCVVRTTYDLATGIKRAYDGCEAGDESEYDEAGRLVRSDGVAYYYSFFPDGRVETTTSVSETETVVARHSYVDTEQATVEYIYWKDALARIQVHDVLGNRMLWSEADGGRYGEDCGGDARQCFFAAVLPNGEWLFQSIFNASHGPYAEVLYPRVPLPYERTPDEVADVEASLVAGMDFSVNYSFDADLLSQVDFAWTTDASLSLRFQRCPGSVTEVSQGGDETQVLGLTERTFYYGCDSDPAPALSCLEACQP